MKKLTLLFVIVLLSSSFGFGQLTLGLKGGYTAFKFSCDVDSVETTFGSGFHGGAFLRIGKRVYLQPEVCYSYTGSTFTHPSTTPANDWKQKVTLGSLDIPVLVGFKIIDTQLITFRIMAGPELSTVLSSSVDNQSQTGPITTDDIKKTNWSGQVGAGVDILFITVDLRYQFGFAATISEASKTFGSNTVTYPLNSTGKAVLVSVGFKIL